MSVDPQALAAVPNALLIGPPKCGTSSVFDWLAQHPQIAGSQPKETFYLVDAGSPLAKGPTWRDAGDTGYSAHFDAAAARKQVRLDATTHHIFQETALAYARAHPDCRIICILREPASRLKSSFEFTRNNLSALRSDFSFGDYVRLVRGGGALDAATCYRRESAYVLERDIGYGEYLRYLRAWREAVGAQRLYVQTFDRLVQDPRGVMTEICGFLGVDPGFYADFSFARKNETVEIRSRAMHRFARQWGRRLAQSPLKRVLKQLYFRAQAGQPAADANAAETQRTLQSLREHYRPHNLALREEFGLDVSAWMA